MSKLKGPGKWRADAPKRVNTGGSTIRGKISAPIPFPDDDEFPIRSPGSGIATPLSGEGIDKQLGHNMGSGIPRPISRAPPDRLSSTLAEDSTPVVERPMTPARASYEPMEPSPPRQQSMPMAQERALTSAPSGSSEGKPQRKKSSLRTVFGKLFGKKAKANGPPEQTVLRAEQHRSVRSLGATFVYEG